MKKRLFCLLLCLLMVLPAVLMTGCADDEEITAAIEGTRIKALTDEALRKEDTGSHVFLYLYGHVLDAMEDFHITLEAQ